MEKRTASSLPRRLDLRIGMRRGLLPGVAETLAESLPVSRELPPQIPNQTRLPYAVRARHFCQAVYSYFVADLLAVLPRGFLNYPAVHLVPLFICLARVPLTSGH